MRTLITMILAAGTAFLLDLAIGRAALRFTHVPKDFPPFNALPILSGAVGGAVLAALGYVIAQAVSKQPDKIFLFLAVGVLALSFSLPLRLSFTKSVRFAGVTPTAQIILVLMHTVVATVTVAAVLARPK